VLAALYILIILYNKNKGGPSSTKRNILVRGVDLDAYRRVKAAAALKGIPLGMAVSEALVSWAKDEGDAILEAAVRANVALARSSWGKLRAKRGKAVVIAEGRLQGVFNTYEEARAFSSRFKVALTFVVEEPPSERELEFGPEMEV